MRMSHWSSDVCSSDLSVNVRDLKTLTITPEFPASQALNVMTYGASTKPTVINTTETIKTIAGFGDGVTDTQDLSSQVTLQSSDATVIAPVIGYVSALKAGTANITASFPVIGADGDPVHDDVRSEEHTSELQSLMRNSYDVFCLKKKNK